MDENKENTEQHSSDNGVSNFPVKARYSLDVAVLLTVGSGVLYILGWTYWMQYFKFFGVDSSFINLPFDQLIATTWWFAYSFILIVYAMLERDVLDKDGIKQVSISLYYSLLALIAVLGGFIFSLPIPIWGSATISVCLFAMLIAFKPKLKTKKIFLGKRLKRLSGQVAISMILLSLALLFNMFLGYHHANSKSKEGSSIERITIKVKGAWQPPKESILIVHMNGKYFICKPVPEGKKPETIIINDSIVENVTVIRNK